MQALYNTQPDELSELFQRQVTLTAPNPATPDQQFEFVPTQSPQPIYFSQHYTQSAHVRPKSALEPRQNKDDSLYETFRQHDINSASLRPSQIRLFQSAQYEQRLKLLELWRIAPPEYETCELAEQFYDTWSQTTMSMEEEMAKQRYEKRLRERELQVTPVQVIQDGNRERAEDENNRNLLRIALSTPNSSAIGVQMASDKRGQPLPCNNWEWQHGNQ